MRLILSFVLLLSSLPCLATADDSHECALDFEAKNIDGETVDLHDYEGNVVLVVNVASKCGLTPQYTQLQKIYKEYEKKGFVVLGFPCNQFLSQEPGTEADIKQFCSTKFNVTFPMFSKVEVNGENAAPIYKYLTSKDAEPKGKGKVSWNFEKFLIDREGNLVNRFEPRTKPDDPAIVKAIETELAKK